MGKEGEGDRACTRRGRETYLVLFNIYLKALIYLILQTIYMFYSFSCLNISFNSHQNVYLSNDL